MNDRDLAFTYSPVRMVGIIAGNNIQCYPNPTRSKLYIAAGNAITGVEVLSLFGAVFVSTHGQDIHELDLENFPKQCYLVRMFRQQQVIATVTVIKQ